MLCFFFLGGGLTFYWCISFARYAIYWYKRLEVKDCFGRKNTKGSDGMEGCFFASIRKGIGPSWQYNHWISLDFIGFFRGGALFSARNIFWKGFRDQISIPSRWKKDGENVSLWTQERSRGKMLASEMFLPQQKKGKRLPWKLKANTFWKLLRGGGGDNV